MRQHYDSDALSQALAEPSRRAILENLRSGQKSVSDLVAATALKQPNVSNHLSRMREQGLVRSERVGRHVYYSIALPVAEILLRLHETTADPLLLSEKVFAYETERLEPSVTSTDAFTEPTPEPFSTEAGPTIVAWRQAFFHSILAGQEDRANALINDMLARRIDLETIYSDVFQWAMTRIGDLYVQGITDEAHEHMASAITERMMGRVAQFYTPIARRPYRALFGAVAGNQHVLGLRMLSDALRTQGWETLYLGADVPTSSFLAMVTSAKPDMVVISGGLEPQWEEMKLLLHQLQTAREELEALHYRIVAGGHYLNMHPDLLSLLPVDFSAQSLREFIRAVAHYYPAVAPHKKK